jgi:hypothetical protein
MAMLSGLPIVLLLAAQAAAESYGPTLPPTSKPKTEAAVSACAAPAVDKDKGEIFVCAPRPEGYRIDPDVLKASKQARNRTRPKRPERLVDNSCASVGPHGCTTTGINLLNAALVLATIAQKAVSGGNVGQMFVTDPELSEYELYKLAKSEREAKEAAQATAAKVKVIKERDAAAAAGSDGAK